MGSWQALPLLALAEERVRAETLLSAAAWALGIGLAFRSIDLEVMGEGGEVGLHLFFNFHFTAPDLAVIGGSLVVSTFTVFGLKVGERPVVDS